MDLGGWCNGTRFVSLQGHRLSWLMKIPRVFSVVLGSVAIAPRLKNVSFCLGTFQFIAHSYAVDSVRFSHRKRREVRHVNHVWWMPVILSIKLCFRYDLLGAFAWSRKAPVSFVMSVRPHVSARRPLDGFPWNLVLRTFMEICQGTPDLVHIGQKCRLLFVKT